MSISKKSYLRFYECCKPTIGSNRGLIHDFQRGLLFFASNQIIELILESNDKQWGKILEEYKAQEAILKKQIDYLYQNELIFFTEEPEKFTKLKEEVEKPYMLEFIFLYIDTFNEKKLEFLKNIHKTGANNVILIFSGSIDFNILNNVLEVLQYSKVKVIEILAKYDPASPKEIEQSANENGRIRNVIFYKADTSVPEVNSEKIKFWQSDVRGLLEGGISSLQDFTVNLDAYLESLSYNLFYYKKVFINDQGEVFKFYGDTNSLGNIYADKLSKMIRNDDVVEFWETSKDKIKECQGCEFRYICPDNRIPVKEEDLYVHTNHCVYNPKTNIWNENEIRN